MVSPTVAACLSTYLNLLVKWNTRINLVGPGTWREILTELALDSFWLVELLESLDLPPEPLVTDLGAGAGIPGIPLRCLWSRGEYVLVEVREKRAMFLKTVLAAVEIPNTRVLAARAESVLPELAPVDVVLARAFLPWRDLLSLVKNVVAPHGYVVVMARTEPDASFPEGWIVQRSMQYEVQGKERWLWALSVKK